MQTNERNISRAIFKGEIEAFNLLVSTDDEINSITKKEHWNFLHQALVSVSLAPSRPMVVHLISRGVDVNAKDIWGNTPLHYAARIKNSEIIELLLNAGSEINAINHEGITPLRQTLLQKPHNLKATEIFLAYGADVNQHTKGGCTTKEYAKIISHGNGAEIYALFEKYSTANPSFKRDA
ncbi:ankyrin repeat domain-containing protein [Iodobacter fluviatilis]|uniref:Ankyrin repeat protein n=1 Tax=Iodobacter fluviatilis TaxID=537 RepID=A0A377Q7T8_9NEIS|nr:ankyrin repeat domain-containing protein [Iodobacter fluviatilis]TCU89418.1 ankyrin repeat protein [Iodobacter fluviatilis]STQ90788.1 Ribulose-5-phosphate 4-epimerase and related epimerases and aldolases [Iodobacter fluviatilis]